MGPRMRIQLAVRLADELERQHRVLVSVLEHAPELGGPQHAEGTNRCSQYRAGKKGEEQLVGQLEASEPVHGILLCLGTWRSEAAEMSFVRMVVCTRLHERRLRLT